MDTVTEIRMGWFLIEVGIIFLFTVLSMYFFAWRIKRYTGTDIFANRTYLYIGSWVVALIIAIGKTVWYNEGKFGRAVI